MGTVVLPTVLYMSKVLAKLAVGLDSRPELVMQLLQLERDAEESTEKVTLVERTANVVREAFIKCLTDRSGTSGVNGRPEGRRVGIYLMLNLCLRLLFQVRYAASFWPSSCADQEHSVESFETPSKCLPVWERSRHLSRISLRRSESHTSTSWDGTCSRITSSIPHLLRSRNPTTNAIDRPSSKSATS